MKHFINDVLFTRKYTLLKVVAMVLFGIWYVCYRRSVTWENLSYGLAYGGDGLWIALDAKNLIDTGWVIVNPYLGAPFTAENYDFVSYFLRNFDSLYLKLLTLFTSDPMVVANVAPIGVGLMILLITFFVLRELEFTDFFAMSGAITYAFSYYFFTRYQGHFVLAMYQFVPLAVLLCVWAYEQKIFRTWSLVELRENKRNWWAIGFCILIASNGIGYYQIFSCFILLVTGILAYMASGERKRLLSALVPIGLITVVFIVNLSPYMVYRFENGKNYETAQRLPIEPDIYGLKITQLLLPPDLPGHSRPEKKIQNYLKSAPLMNENSMSYLGLVGSVGFLILILKIFSGSKDPRTNLFSKLNLACVLLTVMGGFYTLVAVIYGPGPMMRATNRISVYIMFFCVVTVMKLCASWLETSKHKNALLCLMIGVFAFGLYWQCPIGAKITEASNALYASDGRFIKAIEASVPEGSMIYELPYHKYPEHGPVNQMSDYQLAAPYIHSKTLRWSYGAMCGRPADAWHERVAALPWETRLRVLSMVGFEGIFINRTAYKPEEMAKLEAELSSRLMVTPTISDNGTLEYFSMKPYNDAFLSKFTEEERATMRQDLLRPVSMKRAKEVYTVEKKDGRQWQWMDRKVELLVENDGDAITYDIDVTLSAPAAAGSHVTLRIGDSETTYAFENGKAHIHQTITLPHGQSTLVLTTDAPRVDAPNDDRALYMMVENGTVSDFLPKLYSKDLLR